MLLASVWVVHPSEFRPRGLTLAPLTAQKRGGPLFISLVARVFTEVASPL